MASVQPLHQARAVKVAAPRCACRLIEHYIRLRARAHGMWTRPPGGTRYINADVPNRRFCTLVAARRNETAACQPICGTAHTSYLIWGAKERITRADILVVGRH